jgi:hypothetical protein
LARFAAENPDARAIHTNVAMPAAGLPAELGLRSFFVVGHPIVQTVRRYRNWARESGRPANPDGTPDTAGFLRERLARQAVLYPIANFHLGVLAGGRGEVADDEALPAAEALLRGAAVAMADFAHISCPSLSLAVAATGAALAAAPNLSFHHGTALPDLLGEAAAERAPELFAEICARNRADLLFYDAVAADFVDRAPVEGKLRDRMRAVVDAAAETTKHRIAGAVQARLPERERAGLVDTFVEADPELG